MNATINIDNKLLLLKGLVSQMLSSREITEQADPADLKILHDFQEDGLQFSLVKKAIRNIKKNLPKD